MSLASTSHLSLCSSPPLPRTALTKQTPLLFSQTKLLSSKNWSSLSTSTCFLNTQLVKLSIFVVKASETESQTSKPAAESGNEEGGEEAFEEYEVEVVQPYGLKFAKGRDGGTYIDAIAAGGSADKTGKFSVGDKVLATRFALRFVFPFEFVLALQLVVNHAYCLTCMICLLNE